jgi:hypothetical protein
MMAVQRDTVGLHEGGRPKTWSLKDPVSRPTLALISSSIPIALASIRARCSASAALSTAATSARPHEAAAVARSIRERMDAYGRE